MTVEFGEQIARARQGGGLSEQAFAQFVGDPDAAQEELSKLGKAIGAADEAAGQARRSARGASAELGVVRTPAGPESPCDASRRRRPVGCERGVGEDRVRWRHAE